MQHRMNIGIMVGSMKHLLSVRNELDNHRAEFDVNEGHIQHCLNIGVTDKIKGSSPTGQAAKEETDRKLDSVSENLRRLRVVIVEDDAIVAMELEMLLDDLGADVIGVATSADDACALVQKHLPDFVTMDISLKGERDGVSAAIEIFRSHGTRSIFISSYNDQATRKRAEPCEALAWITKPIDTADLSKAVGLVKRRLQ